MRIIAPRLVVLLLAYSLGYTPAASAASNSAVAYVEIVDKSTNSVLIRGSGVLIGTNGFLLTARHVVAQFDPLTQDLKVSLKDKQATEPARLFDCAALNVDICMLYMSTLPSGTAGPPIACRFPVVGEPIIAQGFPPGPNALTTTNGNVAASAFGVQFKTYMTAPLIEGMSGGPVSNSNGELIGIIFGGAEQSGLTFFTPIAFGRTLMLSAGIKCVDD